MGGLSLENVKLLYRNRLTLKLKGCVYKGYVWPTVLRESEVSCPKKKKIKFIKGQKLTVRVMCRVQLKDSK